MSPQRTSTIETEHLIWLCRRLSSALQADMPVLEALDSVADDAPRRAVLVARQYVMYDGPVTGCDGHRAHPDGPIQGVRDKGVLVVNNARRSHLVGRQRDYEIWLTERPLALGQHK